jgi:type I restriction enzyme S subunit
MTEKNAKPQLRFAGFDDTWEQRKFEDIAVRSSSISSESGLPRVEYEDIISGTGRLNKDIFAKESDKTGIVFHKGDVLYGKLRPYLQNWLLPSFNGLAVGDFWVLQPQNADSSFLYRLIQSRQFDEVANQSTGTKMPRSDWKLVSKTEFFIPSAIGEQAAIGAYFEQLDNLITLHQRKYDKLTNVKKSMLEKMFPKNGSNVPEIRFKGFSDAWEQRKLSDLCSLFTDGDWIEAKDQSTEGVRLVQTGNVGVTQYLDKTNNAKWISEDTFSRLKCEEIFEGDILISRLPDPAGRACIMPNLGTKMITAVDCTIVRTLPDVNSEYLVQYLSTERYFKEINACLAGGTRQRVSRGNLAEFDIPLPNSADEQRAIGNYFKSLDNLITLHQRELEKLKNLKKACLEKMFV